MDPALIAKMDALKSDNFQTLGQFWLLPVIAKMDALKVNIIKIPFGLFRVFFAILFPIAGIGLDPLLLAAFLVGGIDRIGF